MDLILSSSATLRRICRSVSWRRIYQLAWNYGSASMQELIPGFQLFSSDSFKKELTLKIKVFLPLVSLILTRVNSFLIEIHVWKRTKKWLTIQDSNLNKVNQNHLCYLYTNGQLGAEGGLEPLSMSLWDSWGYLASSTLLQQKWLWWMGSNHRPID